MQTRRQIAPWIVLGIVGLVAVFVASALLPPFALVFVLMALLLGAFIVVAVLDKHSE